MEYVISLVSNSGDSKNELDVSVKIFGDKAETDKICLNENNRSGFITIGNEIIREFKVSEKNIGKVFN